MQCLLIVHGHLVNLCAVVLLNITQNTDVIVFDKIDGDSFSSITTGSTDPRTDDGNLNCLILYLDPNL